MSKEIGGYFHLELSEKKQCPNFEGVLLNSGRNCLEYILRSIGDVKKLWIPYYTCEAILEPLFKLNISFSFYHINERLEILSAFKFESDEYLLYTNYFGIKDLYISKLISEYKDNIIIDNSQALWAKNSSYSFYSPRKFIGIPDGGIAFTINPVNQNDFPDDISYERCSHLLKRYDLPAFNGYVDFKNSNDKLKNQQIKKMSNLTKAIINSVDFNYIKEQRLINFNALHLRLKEFNLLDFQNEMYECPMVYPFLSEKINLRELLIKNNIFVATYWPNIREWCDNNSLEFNLCNNLIPLPIDQRYNIKDMDFIINIILK